MNVFRWMRSGFGPGGNGASPPQTAPAQAAAGEPRSAACAWGARCWWAAHASGGRRRLLRLGWFRLLDQGHRAGQAAVTVPQDGAAPHGRHHLEDPGQGRRRGQRGPAGGPDGHDDRAEPVGDRCTQRVIARAVEARLVAERDGRSRAFPDDLTKYARIRGPAGDRPAVALFESGAAPCATNWRRWPSRSPGWRPGSAASRRRRRPRRSRSSRCARNWSTSARGGRRRPAAQPGVRAGAAVRPALRRVLEDVVSIAFARRHGRAQDARPWSENADGSRPRRSSPTCRRRSIAVQPDPGVALRTGQHRGARPVDGIVVGPQVHTSGGIIQGGAPMMDIVPQGEPLRIEANVPTDSSTRCTRGSRSTCSSWRSAAVHAAHRGGGAHRVGGRARRSAHRGAVLRAQVVVTLEGMKKLKLHETGWHAGRGLRAHRRAYRAELLRQADQRPNPRRDDGGMR